jgi:bifunctional ADP-heptose synthase (sugar kinase/adenylyltransferase)
VIPFAANLALGLASGAISTDRPKIANAAGGVVVGKIGTGIATLSELESELALGEEPEVS